MNLKGLAKEYDEEEDPIKRGLVASALVNQILEGTVGAESTSVSMGPVTLDAGMAREHGWSELQIERAWSALEAVSSAEGYIASLLHPELFEDDGDGNMLFAGTKSFDHSCAKCGVEFDSHHSVAWGASETILMLLTSGGVHSGFAFKGHGRGEEPEIVCESCGSDRVEETN